MMAQQAKEQKLSFSNLKTFLAQPSVGLPIFEGITLP